MDKERVEADRKFGAKVFKYVTLVGVIGSALFLTGVLGPWASWSSVVVIVGGVFWFFAANRETVA